MARLMKPGQGETKLAKKHIALVSVNNVNPDLSDGGSRATYEILRFLSHQGHPVSFLNFFSSERYRFRDANPVSQTARFGKVLYAESGYGISLVERIVSSRRGGIQDRNALLSRLLETLGERSIDLTVTCDADYLSLLAVSILNLPGVHFFNSIENVKHYERISPAFVGMLRKRSVLTVSDFLRKEIDATLKIPSDVWHNRFDFAVRGMCGHGKGNAVGFYSSGATIKGEAIVKRLIEKMPHVPFVTAGHPLRCPGESEPGSVNLLHLGWIEDMGLFYERLKVLIVPSLVQEGAPRVIVEACSRGIPVIASRLGGIPEALGNSGILVDVDLACNPDVEELAETYKIHIEHLLGDRGVFEAHRKRALDWAEVYREMQERNSQEIYEKYFA
jgi:glycosyltransferase involved in cell wall biosynthesis